MLKEALLWLGGLDETDERRVLLEAFKTTISEFQVLTKECNDLRARISVVEDKIKGTSEVKDTSVFLKCFGDLCALKLEYHCLSCYSINDVFTKKLRLEIDILSAYSDSVKDGHANLVLNLMIDGSKKRYDIQTKMQKHLHLISVETFFNMFRIFLFRYKIHVSSISAMEAERLTLCVNGLFVESCVIGIEKLKLLLWKNRDIADTFVRELELLEKFIQQLTTSDEDQAISSVFKDRIKQIKIGITESGRYISNLQAEMSSERPKRLNLIPRFQEKATDFFSTTVSYYEYIHVIHEEELQLPSDFCLLLKLDYFIGKERELIANGSGVNMELLEQFTNRTCSSSFDNPIEEHADVSRYMEVECKYVGFSLGYTKESSFVKFPPKIPIPGLMYVPFNLENATKLGMPKNIYDQHRFVIKFNKSMAKLYYEYGKLLWHAFYSLPALFGNCAMTSWDTRVICESAKQLSYKYAILSELSNTNAVENQIICDRITDNLKISATNRCIVKSFERAYETMEDYQLNRSQITLEEARCAVNAYVTLSKIREEYGHIDSCSTKEITSDMKSSISQATDEIISSGMLPLCKSEPISCVNLGLLINLRSEIAEVSRIENEIYDNMMKSFDQIPCVNANISELFNEIGTWHLMIKQYGSLQYGTIYSEVKGGIFSTYGTRESVFCTAGVDDKVNETSSAIKACADKMLSIMDTLKCGASSGTSLIVNLGEGKHIEQVRRLYAAARI